MAIWQFQCNIIPIRLNIEELNRDEIISWKGVPKLPHEPRLFKQEKSWSKNVVQYGKLDETCIEFIYEDNMLYEISCRLDLRSLTKTNLISLINYVREIDALFFVGDRVYAPKLEIIQEIMRKSEANQFCKNPVEYILSQK